MPRRQGQWSLFMLRANDANRLTSKSAQNMSLSKFNNAQKLNQNSANGKRKQVGSGNFETLPF
jgi:hypothetical protein